jgi:hypothetical protein
MTLTSGITEDKETAVIELHEDGKALAHITLDAASLEGVIRELGRVRSNMNEIVPLELDPGARIETTPPSSWRVPGAHNGPTETLLLALRHPGLGWLGYLFDEVNARKLGKALLETPVTQPK